MYQNLSQQMLPWMEKAQRYCATDLPKCSSLMEAEDLYNLHQSFVKECEEQLPIFENLNTEAGYLMDQPNVPREIEDLQRRWNDIISSSEDRSHKAEKIYGAWAAYDQEISNFDEVLDKIQGRLGEEPNLHSTDVQVLEHELAIGKTLQEEIKSHQPHLRALEKRFEQVKKHASPEGVQALQSKMDAVKMAYNKTSEDAAKRQNMVGAAVRHRQDFYGQLQDFDKWLKKSQRKLDNGNEIYADEVPDLQAKLKELRAECAGHELLFNALTQELQDLIQNCSEEEAAMLRDILDRMMAGYSKIEDLIKNREDLCEQWVNYSGDQKDVQAKLKSRKQKLQQPDISEEEVNKINKEVEALRKSMAPWNRKKYQLDDLIGTSQLVIKDRATQMTLHFGTELQALENMCDSVSTNAVSVESYLMKYKFDNASQQLADGDPGFTDFGDNNRPQKLGERFAELFDQTWSSAYESLKTKDIDDVGSDEETMDTLQQIVKVIYGFCQTKSQDHLQGLSKEMIPPVVDPTSDNPKSEGYQAGDPIKAETGEMVREHKKLEAQATVKLMQMEIFENHIKDKVLKGEEISKELVAYVEQCVDLIWYMCIQQPPMEIRWAVEGDKFNKEQFRFSGRKGKKYRMTVWPVVFLHRHGPVVSQGYALPSKEP